MAAETYEKEFAYPIYGLAWSTVECRRLAVSSFRPRGGNEVTVFEVRPAADGAQGELKELGRFDHGAAEDDEPSRLPMTPVDLVWSPDPGQPDVLATAADRFVHVWDFRKAAKATKERKKWAKAAGSGGGAGLDDAMPCRPEPLASLQASAPLLSCDWGRGGGGVSSRLATGATDGAVQVWDMGRGESVGVANPSSAPWSSGDLRRGAALHVRWQPDAHVLAACFADGTIAKWDLRAPLGRGHAPVDLIRQDAPAGYRQGRQGGASAMATPVVAVEWGAELPGGGRCDAVTGPLPHRRLVLLLKDKGGAVVGSDRFDAPFQRLGGDGAMANGATAAVCCRGGGARDWVFTAEGDTAGLYHVADADGATPQQEPREYKAGLGTINRVAWGDKKWAGLAFEGKQPSAGGCLQVVQLGFR